MNDIAGIIANEIDVKTNQVAAAIALLDDDNTVPFIARYRKEVTGGLDDAQLRTLSERLGYLRELEDRRQVVLKSIDEQKKLTPELKNKIISCTTKVELEDIYRPYKPKRRTKGQIAIEAGLKPLAEALLANPDLNPENEAKAYFNPEKEIKTVKQALDGAKYILMEQFSDDADLFVKLREYVWNNAVLASQVSADIPAEKKAACAKFQDYFEYEEALTKIPSHRLLAVLRGRNEQFLKVSIQLPQEDESPQNYIANQYQIQDKGRAADKWLQEVVTWTWRVKCMSQIEFELIARLREAAEDQALQVFAKNLKSLLMASPAGDFVTMGLDPGLRTGVKVAVVDGTGKLLDTATIYPHAPQRQWDDAIHYMAALVKKHGIQLVSIGNGTASRETEKLVSELIKKYSDAGLHKIVVSEAGASVYSASELASQEFPKLDVSLRGAVSIARRLQDPLAELVKIDPKAIGVGQYQHDVNQAKLGKKLEAVIEDCVNSVGVDLNTASVSLLARVAGLTRSIAENIVKFRDEHGRFLSREKLKTVPRLGPKAFEQAAGFLRIPNGENILDASAVHPESYYVVEKMATACNAPVEKLMANPVQLKQITVSDFVDDKLGLPSIKDILTELEKPGRDPRPDFQMVEFKEGVETLQDLKPDMVLNGVVSNVTNFGAFVDIGVHQDGLVHVSELSNSFVADPHDIVKTGDMVKVKVQEVDVARKRISLTMKLGSKASSGRNDKTEVAMTRKPHHSAGRKSSQDAKHMSKMAAALKDAFKR